MLISSTIYFDHNASTPPDPAVLDAMLPFFRESFANPHSADHALGWGASRAIEVARASVSSLFGCDSDEVIFTSGATEASNLAIIGAVQANASGRRTIITTAIEHKSVLSIGRALGARGYRIQFAPVDNEGQIDLPQLKDMLDQDVLLVSVAAVNSEIGTIQPIAAINDDVRSVGALFHVDAAQAPMAVTVNGLLRHCDFASVSAHKMYGPQGIGALLARRESQQHLSPVIHGGGQQNGLRSGTLPLALCVGFGQAAELLGDEDEQRNAFKALASLCNLLFERLTAEVPGLLINGPSLGSATRHPGNLNVRLPGCEAQDILALVQPHLAASTGSACASGIPEPSHVLTGIGQSRAEAAAALRMCVGRYSTADQARRAASLIGDAVRNFCPAKARI